jgi:threonine/homoserine/homoserine lactone efflux protein
MWLLPFCLGIGALAGATVAVVVSTGVRDGPVASIGAVGGIICFLIAVALFVLSICYIVLLFRFRSAFNTAIAEADSGVPTQLVNE